MNLAARLAPFASRLDPIARPQFLALASTDPALLTLSASLDAAHQTVSLASAELDRAEVVLSPSLHTLRLADYASATAALADLRAEFRALLLKTYLPNFPALAIQ